MGTHHIDEILPVEDMKFHLRVAEEKDMDDIKRLYYVVYGGNYTLPEVTNSDKMKWALNDPNYVWLLVEDGDKLVASVLFVMDKTHRLGKALAGVVLPEYRGKKLMKRAMRRGMDYVFYDLNTVDAIYGVVRTFVPVGFHRDLQDLGFVDMGIFPNVRKVSKYETHGLKVAFKEEALKARRKTPLLIPQAAQIYNIVKKRLNLEDAQIVPYEYVTPKHFKKYEFFIEKSADIEWKYYDERDSGKLLMSFYPFHYPEILLYTRDKKTRVYIHFEERDGHGDLMGLATDNPDNLRDILENVAEYAQSIGIRYLELLVNAYDADMQKKIYEADFIPCAYFPAMERTSDGVRHDFIVACRTFEALDFKEAKLTDATREYVRTFFKLWTTKIWKDLEHA